jgi:hypothetical protein
VLDAGGQLRQFSTVSGVDFVHGDDQAGITGLEEFEEFLGDVPPSDLTLRRKLCREAEAGSGDCGDAAPAEGRNGFSV